MTRQIFLCLSFVVVTVSNLIVPSVAMAALIKTLPYKHQFQNPIEIHTPEQEDLLLLPLPSLSKIETLESILGSLPDDGAIDSLGCFELRDRAESFQEEWAEFSEQSSGVEIQSALSEHVQDVKDGLVEYNCGRFRQTVQQVYSNFETLSKKKLCAAPQSGVVEAFCVKKGALLKQVGQSLGQFIQDQEAHAQYGYLLDILESHRALMVKTQKSVEAFFRKSERGIWGWYVHLKAHETERVAVREQTFVALQKFAEELSRAQQVIYGMSDILRTYLEELEVLVGDRASDLDLEVPEPLVEKLLKFNDENSGMRYFEQVFGNDLSQHRKRILVWYNHLIELHGKSARVPLGAFDDIFLEYKDMAAARVRYQRMVSGDPANKGYVGLHQGWKSFIEKLKPSTVLTRP